MRSRGIALAAMLAMAPLSASAADLVVWWEEGVYPEEDEAVREIVAAFEEETGNQVQLIRGPQEELLGDLLAALNAGAAPPDFIFTVIDIPHYERRTRAGSSISPMRSATIPICSRRTRSTVSR